MCYLYKEEGKISKIVIKKLSKYNYSNKMLIKKENELFHLLCFMSLNNNFNLYNKIIPNEPGDFILEDNDKKILIEVVTCFGNAKTHIDIENRLDSIFKRNAMKKRKGIYKFTINESINSFKKGLLDKNANKEYINSNEFDVKILLFVTGEYENCSVTGTWIEKNLDLKDFAINKYDDIWILNYFSNGRDGGPTIIKNTIDTINEFKKVMH